MCGPERTDQAELDDAKTKPNGVRGDDVQVLCGDGTAKGPNPSRPHIAGPGQQPQESFIGKGGLVQVSTTPSPHDGDGPGQIQPNSLNGVSTPLLVYFCIKNEGAQQVKQPERPLPRGGQVHATTIVMWGDIG